MFVIGGGAMLAPAQDSAVLDEGVAPHEGLDEIYRRFSEGYKKLDPAAVGNLSPTSLIRSDRNTAGWKFRFGSRSDRSSKIAPTTSEFIR